MKPLKYLYLIFLTYANLSPKVPSTGIEGGDKIAHFLEFFSLGLISGNKLYIVFPVIFESLQVSIPGRSFSFMDMATNLIGFGVGYLVWRWWNEGSNGRA